MQACATLTTLRRRLRAIRHVLLDMDGTIYCGGRLFETTKPFLKTLDSLGIGHSFLTNNSSKSVEDYQDRLSRMGLDTPRELLYTSTLFAADYIKERMPRLRRLYVIGTESMKIELQGLGFDVVSREPDAVLAGYDMELSYKKLGQAAFWLERGVPFIATHPDKICPSETPDFLALDCGFITEFLQIITGCKALALGKPRVEMIEFALRRFKLTPADVAVCGDRYGTDIKMALDSGAFSVHVADAPCGEAAMPDMTVRHLMEFGEDLKEARFNS